MATSDTPDTNEGTQALKLSTQLETSPRHTYLRAQPSATAVRRQRLQAKELGVVPGTTAMDE